MKERTSRRHARDDDVQEASEREGRGENDEREASGHRRHRVTSRRDAAWEEPPRLPPPQPPAAAVFSVLVPSMCELLGAVERDQEVVLIGRRVRCDLALDLPVENEANERLGERLHREELPVLDRLVDRLSAPLADELCDARVDDHDLDRSGSARRRRAGAAAG